MFILPKEQGAYEVITLTSEEVLGLNVPLPQPNMKFMVLFLIGDGGYVNGIPEISIPLRSSCGVLILGMPCSKGVTRCKAPRQKRNFIFSCDIS